MIEDFEEILVEDLDTDEEHPIAQFRVDSYWPATKRNGFGTIEEAEQHVRDRIKKNPFNTREYYISEVRQVVRSVPVADTQIQSVDLNQYFNQRQALENLENEPNQEDI